MNWIKKLTKLEHDKEWDKAIKLLEGIIKKNPNDMQAYLQINFLIMNLLVEEEKYDFSQTARYENLIKKYFDISYSKFHSNAEYLFFTGITAVISEWYFGIEQKDYLNMLEQAMLLEPDNLLYKRSYYIQLDLSNPQQEQEAMQYAKIVLDPRSPIQKQLKEKGFMGKYLLNLMINSSKRVLGFLPRLK